MSIAFGERLQGIVHNLYKRASENPSEDGCIRISATLKDDASLVYLVDFLQREGDRLRGNLEISEVGVDGSYDCDLVMEAPEFYKDFDITAVDLGSGSFSSVSYKRGSYKKKLCVPKGCLTVAEAAQAYEDRSHGELGVSGSTHYRRLKDLRKLISQGHSSDDIHFFYEIVEL